MPEQEVVKKKLADAMANFKKVKPIRPFVTLSYAQSIDGRISAAIGSPTLLSGERSMKVTHLLRSLHDGILIGVRTLLADDPSLNVRLVKGNNPQPIIVDSAMRCPVTCKLLTDPNCRKPIILTTCTSYSDVEKKERRLQLEKAGAQVIVCSSFMTQSAEERVDLRSAFELLFAKGINTIMVEGGSAIITTCLEETCNPGTDMPPLVDFLLVTIAPTILGAGVPSVECSSPMTLRCSEVSYVPCDQDVLMIGRFN